MTLESLKISSEQFWVSGVITAIVDIIFILIWRIKSAHFRDLKWTIVGAAAILKTKKFHKDQVYSS